MQNLIVGLIVIAAVVYLVRRFYKRARALETDTCGCGCDGCTRTTLCDQMPPSEKER